MLVLLIDDVDERGRVVVAVAVLLVAVIVAMLLFHGVVHTLESEGDVFQVVG